MISSKERAFLKRVAASQSAVYQIGKDGLNEANLNGIMQVLSAREIAKINVLQNCDELPKDLANAIAEELKCEIVGVIGRKIIIYKLNPKNKKHVLTLE